MKKTVLVVVFAAWFGGLAAAQTPAPSAPLKALAATPAASPAPAPPPEVPPADAGEDAWEAFMKRYREIRKFPKELVVRLGPNTGYPAAFMRRKMEIVDEDDQWVYMRNLPIEDPESASHKSWLMRQAIEIREVARQEEAEGQFVLDPAVEHPLPAFCDRIHFEERSAGLPNQGRWGLGLAVADMNGDGLPDLVLPPPRLGVPRPVIVLQTPDGWRTWETVTWPDVKLDYGDVEVADFDGDGHLDIAIACHFLRIYVMYGNGKGDFTRVVELPRASERITSRAIAQADFDGDGRQDLVALAELDVDLATNAQHIGALVQVLLNTSKGWQAVAIEGGDQHIYGDHVAAGDLDGDGHPDFVVASHKNANRRFMFVNRGDGRSFQPIENREFPNLGYVFGVAAGDLDGRPGAEELMGAFQNVRAGSRQYPMNGVVVYKLERTSEGFEVQRNVVAVDGRELDAYVSAAILDVDGDGRNDLVMGRRTGAVEIYLQGLEGQFFREQSPELDLGDAYINAFAMVPIGTKGERALVVMSSDGPATAGSVRAFVVRRGPLTKQASPR
ncbi:MAG TPA: VCBS repeat-containing protein [Thermoanaerobaculaceae bacterium]|nr:VCBS repeat-containing protein [Thermoanaerobaculaceae bacterium]HRS15848.1 VCBS repeat-containing protein [Thermoanaerobaculaceae bacterium]